MKFLIWDPMISFESEAVIMVDSDDAEGAARRHCENMDSDDGYPDELMVRRESTGEQWLVHVVVDSAPVFRVRAEPFTGKVQR